MKPRKGPYPSPGFRKMVEANSASPITEVISGEITADVRGAVLGAAPVTGFVRSFWISLRQSGKDDSNTLSAEADLKINGVSCLTTKPKIAHVSGEASTNKTTRESTDTGITQSVIDRDNDDVALGDLLTYDLDVTRTASPTTEMAQAALVVEIEPD